MKHKHLTAGLLAFAFGSPLTADLPALEIWMQAQVEAGNVIGCSAQVTRGGETIFLDAFGDRSPGSGDSLQEDQIVRIYSMSKAITSAAIMQLVEQGRLGIDDPVSKALPEFASMQVGMGDDARPASRQITIRDLLTHTSGLAYGFTAPSPFKEDYEAVFIDTPTLEDAAGAMAQLPLLHDPGAEFTYGLSTDVLGRVVEVVSGQPFEAYLSEHIFEPLRMTDTAFAPPENLEPMHIVTGAPGSLKIDAAHYAQQRQVALKPRFASGGGGLWSTLHDYTRFMMAMEQGGQLEGRRILRRGTVAFMTQNQLSPGIEGSMRFGLGFGLQDPVSTPQGLRGGDRWTWGGAASTFFFIDPDQDLTAIFITQKFPYDFVMGDQFHRTVLAAVADAEAPEPAVAGP